MLLVWRRVKRACEKKSQDIRGCRDKANDVWVGQEMMDLMQR